MINHKYWAAGVILELVALLMALNDQYIQVFHGENFALNFGYFLLLSHIWLLPAVISYVNVLAAS